MNSSRLETFQRSWKEQWGIMVGRHYDEREDYRNETETKKKDAIESARVELEILRNKATCRAEYDDEASKIKEARDAALASIERQYKKCLRIIEEAQRKEQASHDKARDEALAARSFMDDDSPSSPAAVTANDPGTVKRGDAASTSRTPESKSPGSLDSRIPRAEDNIPAAAPPREQDQSETSEKGFSTSIQREFAADGEERCIFRYKTKNRKALQEALESRARRPLHIDTSVGPLRTPVSVTSTTGDELGASRTITFGEVYQNGHAQHKDTIVEFPPNSRQWYILKCEEHDIRFGQRPIAGAAKHLNGQPHGGLPRSHALAIKILGYRVIDCNERLAQLNNKVVSDAFADGYKPLSNRHPASRMVKPKRNYNKRTKNATQGASDSVEYGLETPAVSQGKGTASKPAAGRNSSSSPLQKWHKTGRKSPKEIITNPKAFHIYNCFWNPERRVYPAMILGWDDQKPGGLEKNLAATGLLDEESTPPDCYVYKDTDDPTDAAIIGWSSGFEDGGPRIEERRFPVMFFLLPEPRSGSLTTPLVSPITEADECSDDSDTESSVRSSVSNVTEKELLDMQDTAGEIDGDSDYAGSGVDSTVDSTLEDEYDSWEQPEGDGKPWAFYVLRNAECTKTGPVTPSRGAEPKNTEATLPSSENVRMARSSSVHECSQRNGFSAIEGPVSVVHTAQTSGQNNAERGFSPASRVSTDRIYTSSQFTTDLKEGPKGAKRARSEEKTGMNVGMPGQDNVKKAKLGTPDNQVAIPVVGERAPTPMSPAIHTLLSRASPRPAAFELSTYSKGRYSWNRESEASSIKLYYGEGDRTVSTVDELLKIAIDPTTLRGFVREEIFGSNGNSMMTLLAKDLEDAPVKVVFDRARGSKADIGKIQVRSFIRWLRSVNPAIQLLEG
ncbi:hypothetical protein EKO27_g4995 [Xylaria grammica]|uniref:Uncharacterized protein n=1 Tax=Xylaria grammica TaxID=363999 RepID=A0A439D6S7_9PEZI|nr:hypothetical protein EKO27_g4995 [Xylaria grammica]